jgi:hypothetical protein
MKRCGIYFLIKNGEVVYIGQTINYPIRLKAHDIQKMDYETVKFIECAQDKLSFYEKRWIQRFLPKHNVALKHPRKNALPPIKEHTRNQKINRHMKFRKLTEKSTIGFGNYKDWTVESMLQREKYFDLISMYYGLSHITFFDNILDRLKISPEWRIDKPGINKERGYEFKNSVWPEVAAEKKSMSISRAHRLARSKMNMIDAISKDKQWLKNRNQGH